MNFICKLLGHNEEFVDEETFRYGPPLYDNSPPAPKPGRVLIEHFKSLHWISEITKKLFRCSRCGEGRIQESSHRGGVPIRISGWYSLQASGRVVPPLKVSSHEQEKQTERPENRT